MSAQEVADACEEIGYPIPRNVIANMESGRRTNLPLTEVMVLAKALHTNPISLIIPVGRIDEYQALPLRDPVPAWRALSWFTGEEDSLDSDWSLRLFRMHHDALDSAQDAAYQSNYYRHHGSTAPNPERRARALRSAEHFEQLATEDHDTLRRIRAQMRSEGLHLPLLAPGLEFIDEHPHDLNAPEENED